MAEDAGSQGFASSEGVKKPLWGSRFPGCSLVQTAFAYRHSSGRPLVQLVAACCLPLCMVRRFPLGPFEQTILYLCYRHFPDALLRFRSIYLNLYAEDGAMNRAGGIFSEVGESRTR
jgi:hypothetical protein